MTLVDGVPLRCFSSVVNDLMMGKCKLFSFRYQDLMDKGEERKRKLEDSIQRYSLLRDAHELESWINDKVSPNRRSLQICIKENLC